MPMYPTLTLGPFIFPTAGLVLIAGAWLCLAVVERAARRTNLNAPITYTLAVVGMVAGFAGARLAFVAAYWPAHQHNLWGVIWPLTNGYEPAGGLLIGVTAAFFYGRARQLPFAATLDALTPAFILGMMIISLADFLGGPGYGILTAVPWGLNQYGVRRHPVQLYELLVGALALLAWWRWSSRRQFSGQLCLISLAVYSAGRLFLDPFRANSWIIGGGYHGWQLVSLAVLLISLFLLARQQESQEKHEM